MKDWEIEQAEATKKWYADNAAADAEVRVAACLRYGWRPVTRRTGALGGLRTEAEYEVENAVEVEVFERPRPPKPVRGGVEISTRRSPFGLMLAALDGGRRLRSNAVEAGLNARVSSKSRRDEARLC